jgi:succinoglycan biosynthesis transport protein ExoP
MPNQLNGARRGGMLIRPDRQSGDQYLYYPTPVNDPSAKEHSQVLEYLRIISRHLGSILLLAALGVGAGALAAYFTKPKYQSRVSLDIQQFDQNILNMKSGADPGANANSPAESYIQTEIKVLQSEVMVLRVIKTLKEAKPGDTASTGKESDLAAWSKSFTAPRPAQPLNLEAELYAIGRNVKVRTLGVTRIVELLCDSQDPKLAAQFCNTMADEYIKQNSEKREATLAQTESWLKSELDQTKAQLTLSEEKLAAAAKDSRVLGTENENLAQVKLQQLQGELSQAESEVVRKKSTYDEVKTLEAESPGATVVDGPGVQYKMKIEDLRRQLAELSATVTPDHYKYQAVERQIASLESALTDERKATVRRLWSDYQAADHRKSMLKDDYTAQMQDLSSQAPKAVQYNMLKSEVESGRQLYEAMLHRVQELGIASAMRASTINVVDRAQPATTPSSPNMKSNCLGGFFCGTFLGIGLAFLRSRSDRSLQEPGDAPGLLNVRELGVIPSASIRRSRSFLRRRDPVRLSGGGNAYREMIDLPPESLELATLHQRQSVLAESFSAAMNSILFANENGINAKVIVITSPEPGDGKTTVASNLAIALAQIDRKVLLIDGDLRRTRLSSLFRTDSEAGLIELLRSQEPVAGIPVSSVGSGWQLPNLFFLGAGDHALFEPRLLHSARMAQFISRVREEFDIVLIDSTPMVHIADARVLGRLADGVLLVFRAGKTTIEMATAAQRCFIDDGTHVLGTILNDWNASHSAQYKSYKRYSKATA